MNLRTFARLLVASLLLVGTVTAVKVDLPGQAEKESPIIVTGRILSIYSRITRDESYEWHNCIAAIRVESIDKGTGFQSGDLVYARYIASNKWIAKGTPPPGPGGHNNVPAEGDRRKVCLTRNADGGLDVYYVSGFQPASDSKP